MSCPEEISFRFRSGIRNRTQSVDRVRLGSAIEPNRTRSHTDMAHYSLSNNFHPQKQFKKRD